jgi:hypothetical protein
MMAQIKELQSPSAKESQSADITDDPIVAPHRISFKQYVPFLNLRTADPSISEKIFDPENTTIFYAIPALRTRTHSVVRQGCDRIHANLIGFRRSMTQSEWCATRDQ